MTKTEMELTKQENNIYFTWKPHVVYIYQEPKTEMHIESWQNAVTHGKCSRQS